MSTANMIMSLICSQATRCAQIFILHSQFNPDVPNNSAFANQTQANSRSLSTLAPGEHVQASQASPTGNRSL